MSDSVKLDGSEDRAKMAVHWKTLTGYRDRINAMTARHAQEQKDMMIAYERDVGATFKSLVEKYVPDPDRALKVGSFYIDVKHYEAHGDAYIVRAEVPINDANAPPERFLHEEYEPRGRNTLH